MKCVFRSSHCHLLFPLGLLRQDGLGFNATMQPMQPGHEALFLSSCDYELTYETDIYYI